MFFSQSKNHFQMKLNLFKFTSCENFEKVSWFCKKNCFLRCLIERLFEKFFNQKVSDFLTFDCDKFWKFEHIQTALLVASARFSCRWVGRPRFRRENSVVFRKHEFSVPRKQNKGNGARCSKVRVGFNGSAGLCGIMRCNIKEVFRKQQKEVKGTTTFLQITHLVSFQKSTWHNPLKRDEQIENNFCLLISQLFRYQENEEKINMNL